MGTNLALVVLDCSARLSLAPTAQARQSLPRARAHPPARAGPFCGSASRNSGARHGEAGRAATWAPAPPVHGGHQLAFLVVAAVVAAVWWAAHGSVFDSIRGAGFNRAMPPARLPYLHHERTRHGRMIWTVRVGHGPRTRLACAVRFGSSSCGNIERPSRNRAPTASLGTMRALSAGYGRSIARRPAWAQLSPATKKQRNHLMKLSLERAAEPAARDLDPQIRHRRARLSRQHPVPSNQLVEDAASVVPLGRGRRTSRRRPDRWRQTAQASKRRLAHLDRRRDGAL